MNVDQKPVIWTVVVASIILLIAGFIAVLSINSNLALATQALNNIDVPTTEAVVSGILAGIVIPEIVQPEFPEYMLSEDEYESNLIEAKAEELALEEVDMSKSFREFIMKALNNESGECIVDNCRASVDDYKDIEEIYSVKVKDVNVTEETAVVKIEFKVKYFNDGDFDEDEEDLERAKLLVRIKIKDLVFDDDFEDAEVDEESFVEGFKVKRIYDN